MDAHKIITFMAVAAKNLFPRLFEARRRYGLSVLNYTVTSNHIHRIVTDDKSRNVIADSIKLIAGRTGREFNHRKARKGAYWEDRYHATAIEDGDHYIAHFGAKSSEIGAQNTYVWDQNFENAMTSLGLSLRAEINGMVYEFG